MTASHLVFLKNNFKEWLRVPDSCPQMYDILLATHHHFEQKRRSWLFFSMRQRPTTIVLTDVITGASLRLAAALSLGMSVASSGGRGSKANSDQFKKAGKAPHAIRRHRQLRFFGICTSSTARLACVLRIYITVV